MQNTRQLAAPSIRQWGLDGSTPHTGASTGTDVRGAMTQIGYMIWINTKSPSPEGAAGQIEPGTGAGGWFALRASSC